MKCPGCGAEIEEGKICSYCGTQISYQMKKEQDQLNKKGCPSCGSSNIQFTRENQGEVRDKNRKRIIYRTVGFCTDCGHTWYPNVSNSAPKSNTMLWWVLGWLFFFPAPVMVLIWRKKNTWDIKVKIAVTVVFWVIILTYSMLSPRTNNASYNHKKNSSYAVENAEDGKIIESGSSRDLPENISEESVFPYNDTINTFINRYNKSNPDDIITSELAQRYYHHGSLHDDQSKYVMDGFEVVLSGQSYNDSLKVLIKESGRPNMDSEEYKAIFIKYAKAFDTSLTDEQLNEYWVQLNEGDSNDISFEVFEARLSMFNNKIEMLEIEGIIK